MKRAELTLKCVKGKGNQNADENVALELMFKTRAAVFYRDLKPRGAAREKRGSSKLNKIETDCVKQMKLIRIGREGGGEGGGVEKTQERASTVLTTGNRFLQRHLDVALYGLQPKNWEN